MEKKCGNCRHVLKTAKEYPCNNCYDTEHFEPAVDALVRAKTLDTAKEMITGHRERDYGSPEKQFPDHCRSVVHLHRNQDQCT